MADTQRLDKPDYFGQNWTSKSPTRVQATRSPGPSYISEHARSQIRPGANNSFNMNGSPIRGLRQSNKPASPAGGSSRPQRGGSQDRGLERITTPIEHIRSQIDYSNYSGDDRARRRRTPSQDRTEEHGAGHSEFSSTQHDSANHAGEDRTRRRRAPSQKAMLSQALQKANHAVVLDNAQNFQGAMQAYHDACDLLQQVMLRSSGGDDRKKLEAIRNTYRNRINELQANELAMAAPLNKALPDVPISPYAVQKEQLTSTSDEDEEGVIETATPLYMEREIESSAAAGFQTNIPYEPVNRQPFELSKSHSGTIADEPDLDDPAAETTAVWRHELEAEVPTARTATLAAPIGDEFVPRPLSPKPPASPQPQEAENQDTAKSVPPRSGNSGHQRLATMESTSWLDTIEESNGSTSSSVHSRTSSAGLRRKHIRHASGDTEAQFDAALDAAVEAAYDDGYELMDDEEEPYQGTSVNDNTYLNELRKNVDLARQRVKDAEREVAILAARESERKRLEDGRALQQAYDDDQAEEEERMLENMTRNYVLEKESTPVSRAIPPRQSDSSGSSGRTIGSSIGSTLTAGTSLSTVAEAAPIPSISTQTQPRAPMAPPPTGALPAPPVTKLDNILPASRFVPGVSPRTSSIGLNSPGVRERRLSGQKVRELTINTTVKLPASLAGPKTHSAFEVTPLTPSNQLPEAPRSATLAMELTEEPEDTTIAPNSGLPDSSKLSVGQSPRSASRGPDSGDPNMGSASPARNKAGIVGLRKNFSASSLRSLSRHGGGTPNTDDIPGTPMMRMFSAGSLPSRSDTMPVMPDVPTPVIANLSKVGINSIGMSFFDTDIHSPRTPGSPNASSANPLVELEPCPESFLLRPFWLLRALYQTIAHPRGGYISTRLFVSRDTWRVMNVKLKNLDEKVANCDLLTAALLKLAKVDTLDADAVLEEMQAFELILDQVQSQLTKKLGAEVGVNGAAALFRSSPLIGDDIATMDSSSKASSNTSKSYLSWKRLRSKNSTGPGLPIGGSIGSNKTDSKNFISMESIPMTASSSRRFAKRDPTKVLGIGPHSHYMASLGRLCDAVQVLDQIARQVEDPGLRLSSQTHVGLELSIRHAAEFFAFYICRFALADLGMMLDKFVKRGSEWAMT